MKKALFLQLFLPALGFFEVRIAAVNDDVAGSRKGLIRSIVQSTGPPALTRRMILRGRSSERTKSSGVCAPIICLPAALR